MGKAGWVADLAGFKLGDSQRQAFERDCAPAQLGDFVAILNGYVALFQPPADVLADSDKPVRPAALRDELEGVVQWAFAQRAFLNSISYEARDAMAAEGLLIAGQAASALRRQIYDDLERLWQVAEVARRRAEAATSLGRGAVPKQKLALALARLISDAGLPLETGKRAALRKAYGLALSALGVDDAHEQKTLQSALKAWQAENGNNVPAAP